MTDTTTIFSMANDYLTKQHTSIMYNKMNDVKYDEYSQLIMQIQ